MAWVQWFPIDTAPRNKYVLVRRPSGSSTTPYRILVARHDADYRPHNPWVNHNNDAVTDEGEGPDLWMPLDPFL